MDIGLPCNHILVLSSTFLKDPMSFELPAAMAVAHMSHGQILLDKSIQGAFLVI